MPRIDHSCMSTSSSATAAASRCRPAGWLALGEAQVSSTGMTVTVAAADAVLDLTDNSTVTYSGSYGNGSGSGHIRLSNGNLFVGPSGATFTFAAGLLEWRA